MTKRGTAVYVLAEGDDGPVKVGIASSVSVRLATLQTGNPRKLKVAGFWVLDNRTTARLVESRSHEYMADTRLSGEWFCESACGACGVVASFVYELVRGKLRSQSVPAFQRAPL